MILSGKIIIYHYLIVKDLLLINKKAEEIMSRLFFFVNSQNQLLTFYLRIRLLQNRSGCFVADSVSSGARYGDSFFFVRSL